ncbi:MAG: FHA domain-containing protein [Woeseiaceae bacterium]
MSEIKIILKKVGTDVQVPVTDGLVAGRLDECGLVLTEGHPSRQHAKFNVGGNESQVEDLGSSNGTFVNDQKISGAVLLRSGDRIRFDVEEYEYQVVGEVTEVRDAQATQIRKIEPEDVDIDGSQRRERPAWIDPEKQAAGGPKTEFIDAAAMKEMIEVDGQQGAADVADDVETPILLVTSGEKKGQRFNLRTSGDRGEWTIGCDGDRDIVIPDQGVSGIHAKLAQDGRRWKLTDQMSANSTFVNGRRSNMSYLNNGDRIRFGPVDCVFRTPDEFGTATLVTSADNKPAKSRNIILAVLGFIVTMAIIFAVMQFL